MTKILPFDAFAESFIKLGFEKVDLFHGFLIIEEMRETDDLFGDVIQAFIIKIDLALIICEFIDQKLLHNTFIKGLFIELDHSFAFQGHI